MRKNGIKIFSFVFCFAMLLSLSVLTVAAGDQEHVPVEWTMDEELRYIYGGEKRYDRYYVNYAFYGDAKSSFYFMNYALLDGKKCQVYGESADPHIVSVKKGDGYSYIFADIQGKKILNDFLTRKECIYYLESFDEYTYSVIEEAFVTSLESAYNSNDPWISTVNVSELSEGEILEITVHDKTETKAYQHGAIYIMPSGTYYYVCFEELNNSYFDADGYFSYRKGTVQALKLNNSLCADVDAVIEQMIPREKKIIYESDVVAGEIDIYGNSLYDVYTPEYRSTSIVIFFVMFIFLGILLPILLLVLGLIFARKTKCWYALSVSAAVWIVGAVILLLLLIL